MSLEFQAAFHQAEIYVNGTKVGEHIGGYNGFSIDITSAIKTGDNVVAVRLNNKWNARIPPLTGDHTFQGGLYRNVFVVVTDPLHVAWYGTWVTTPTLATSSGSSSTVAIKTEVQNNRSAAVNATLKTDIVDKDGKVVATISSQQQIAAGKTVTFDQTTPAISNPSLWHPDHPTMYRALSYLSDGTGTVDEFATPFGFRWFSWSASQGFSLNGAHYWIQGANLHQDHAGWGNGVTRRGSLPRRQDGQGRGDELHPWFALSEGAGLRGRLRPARPPVLVGEQLLGWLRRCGRMALQRRLSEHVRRFRRVRCQRPREPHGHDPHPSQSPEHHRVEHGQRGLLQRRSGRQGRRAAQEARSPSPTSSIPRPRGGPRPSAARRRKVGGVEPGPLGDIAGYNGDGVGYDNPGIPNMVSEYGADVSTIRPGNYDPGWNNLTVMNGMAAQPAWRSGISRWCMFDYGSQMGNQYINSGIVDYFRIPKRSYYWYRNSYAKVPPPTWPTAGTPAGLKLTSSTATLSAVDGTQDAWLLVTVVDSSGKPISNNVPVTLTIKSGPGEFPTGPSITFTPPGSGSASDIGIRDGQAAIEFRTYYSGVSIIEATSPGLASSSVTITSQGSPAWVEGTTPKVAPRPYQP